jgi:hypothetical protein
MSQEKWITVGNPGYFGAQRDVKYAAWDKEYGKGNWRIGWIVRGFTTDFLGCCALYEDSYYNFLLWRLEIRQRLIAEACDVYDDAPSNVLSGLDYTKQETGRTHVQDIAIRRSLVRLGARFEGDKLIRIRDKEGEHPLSMILSPGQVPFIHPDMLDEPLMSLNDYDKHWIRHGSVEDFYQRNKRLEIRG